MSTMKIQQGKTLVSIPMNLLQPFERQADINHGQTLQRLNERGGLCPSEALAIIRECRWRSLKENEAQAETELINLINSAQ